VDDVPVTLLAAQLGLEFVGRIDGGSGSGGFQRVGRLIGVVVGLTRSFYGCVVSGGFVSLYGCIVEFGRSRRSLGLFRGFHRRVLALIQLSLSYLELVLRHLVSCFLIA
jgi:hypothetical protein